MSQVYAFLANGFEEIECLSVVDLLRRANIDTAMVSITNNKYVTGAHNITVQADILFEETDLSDASALFLPGGMPGTKYLSEHEGLAELLLSFHSQNRRLAAICAAPSVFGKLGILNGRRATCYPGFEEQCIGASMERTGVITDGHITTARGPGFSIDLGLELIRLLADEKTSQNIKTGIQYPDGAVV